MAEYHTCEHYVERSDGKVEVCEAVAHLLDPYFLDVHGITRWLCAACYDWVCKNREW
jgi:hypothetical protein